MRTTTRPVRPGPQHTTAGFTLIEMMIVVAILAFLMGAFALLMSGVSDRTKIESTKIRLAWLKDGIRKFSANFRGQGVVPDRWASDALGGFDSLPEDLDYPAVPDETLDKSSQYLAFWLGHHLLVWRTENRSEGPVRKPFDPAIAKLAQEHFKVLDQNLSSTEREKIIEDLLEGFRDPDTEITIGELDQDSGSTKPKEVRVWDFEPDNTGNQTVADIKLLIQKIVIVDAWERPIRYKVARDLSDRPTRYLLASAGPDGRWGNDDDIKLTFPAAGKGGAMNLEEPEP